MHAMTEHDENEARTLIVIRDKSTGETLAYSEACSECMTVRLDEVEQMWDLRRISVLIVEADPVR